MKSVVRKRTACVWVFIVVCFLAKASAGTLSYGNSQFQYRIIEYNGEDIKLINEFEYDANPIQKYIGDHRQQTVNTTCHVSSAINQFPKDLFTKDQLKHGAFLLHILAAIYCFTFLAVLCNYYFLPAVECVCEDFSIPKDVAAAIVMATATAMPEFFTNTISTLITNSNMGLGNIIGSLMFNTLGSAAICGLAVRKPLQLDWWPVCRDCTIYFFHTCILMIVAWGGEITFIESCVMLCFLILYYIVIILTNYKLKNRLRIFVEDHLNCCYSTRYDLTLPEEHSAKGKLPFHKSHKDRRQSGIYVITPTEFTPSPTFSPEKLFPDDSSILDKMGPAGSSPFRLPRGKSLMLKFWWAYSWPIRFILACTCPNPKTMRKLYPLTFAVCIVMLGANSYLMMWMLTVFGSTFGIPDVVMGLTILSAGGATPEGFSSAVSARRGESGVGISNSLGTNSLTILLSLGLPWFIKSAINMGSQQDKIHITSDGIEYLIAVLMLSTVTLFVVLAIFGFRLKRAVGIVLLIAYLVYISLQVMIELNVFFPSEDGC